MSKADTDLHSIEGILVVRLGAMGDLVHTLPAVASLKHSFPSVPLTWVVETAWAPLLEQNPFVDHVITLDRKRPATWWRTRGELMQRRYSVAIDFQGLLKSALIASLARAERIVGNHLCQARERAASLFYSIAVESEAVHAVDRNLDLASAAGAVSLLRSFPLPAGAPEGDLPAGGFILASPLAGWASKQWPLEYYAEFARISELPLVLNGPPSARALLESVPGTITHISGIPGLIDATRRAAGVIGVDSGPMHLAAALNKPGVAIFGPTDETRNGPYSNTLKVLRSEGAAIRYRPGPDLKRQMRSGAYARGLSIDPGMRAVTPEQVAATLKVQAACHA